MSIGAHQPLQFIKTLQNGKPLPSSMLPNSLSKTVTVLLSNCYDFSVFFVQKAG